jgi:hypothetical protein
MEDYYNFILILYFGFLFIYLTYPEPFIFYRNNKIYECNITNKELCIEK